VDLELENTMPLKSLDPLSEGYSYALITPDYLELLLVAWGMKPARAITAAPAWVACLSRVMGSCTQSDAHQAVAVWELTQPRGAAWDSDGEPTPRFVEWLQALYAEHRAHLQTAGLRPAPPENSNG
jgi:hypothetical protein